MIYRVIKAKIKTSKTFKLSQGILNLYKSATVTFLENRPHISCTETLKTVLKRALMMQNNFSFLNHFIQGVIWG